MTYRPWLDSQNDARNLAGSARPKLLEIRAKFERRQISAIDALRQAHDTIAELENRINYTMTRHQPPLKPTPQANAQRVLHQKVLTGCLEIVRDSVAEVFVCCGRIAA